MLVISLQTFHGPLPPLISKLPISISIVIFLLVAIKFHFERILLNLFPVSFFGLITLAVKGIITLVQIIVMLALLDFSVILVVPLFIFRLIVICVFAFLTFLLLRGFGARPPLIFIKPLWSFFVIAPTLSIVMGVVWVGAVRPLLVSTSFMLCGHGIVWLWQII
jgi:hypothetical protein